MVEEFKDIEGYNGMYKISNLGNVLSAESYVTLGSAIYRRSPRVLKTASNGRGYRYITISINRKRQNHYVHRLVAQAWVPNPMNFVEVNHKDFDKSNNRKDNLEWVSTDQNRKHYSDSNRGKLLGSATKKPVINVKTKETLGCAKLISGVNYGSLKDGLRTNLCYNGWSYRVDLFNMSQNAVQYCLSNTRKTNRAFIEVVPYPSGYDKKSTDKDLMNYFD